MNTAIILAGGRGSRMNSDIPKQYIPLGGKPLLFYAIDTFEKSPVIDAIILVAGVEYMDFCKNEIVKKYDFQKVTKIIAGGKERYDSVYAGLQAMEKSEDSNGMVFIHDGARACITENVIALCAEETKVYKACVAAVPVKDTIKVADAKAFALDTPDRKTLWQIQTPQAFDVALIQKAYTRMINDSEKDTITDDAMVVERYTDQKVKLTMGDYHNMKVTTPEDLQVAEVFLRSAGKLC